MIMFLQLGLSAAQSCFPKRRDIARPTKTAYMRAFSMTAMSAVTVKTLDAVLGPISYDEEAMHAQRTESRNKD